MNKSSGRKQPILRNSWFEKKGSRVAQSMNFLNNKNELISKRIQQILEERGLWTAKGLNLSYLKPNTLIVRSPQSVKSVLKVINVTHGKDFNNAVQPTILKIDNVMLMFIGGKFVSKNYCTICVGKRENMGIMKTYHLNALLMVIIY